MVIIGWLLHEFLIMFIIGVLIMVIIGLLIRTNI
jgi:hypothetical protein